jgi:hypothetical protein
VLFSKEEVHTAKKTHEDMLSIPVHKRNANQNHIKISTSLLFLLLPSITQTTANVDEVVVEKEPLYTAGGNAN